MSLCFAFALQTLCGDAVRWVYICACSDSGKHQKRTNVNIGLILCQGSSIPELNLAKAAESEPQRAVVHSFSTESMDPWDPTLLMLPLAIVLTAPSQNKVDP